MNRALVGILVAGLVGLVWFSLHLAATRIYQVDECTEVFVARVLTTDAAATYPGAIPLLQFPLSWIIRGAAKSADLFAAGRLLMVAIFWLNLALITIATGEKLFSQRGLIALAGAATLAPLWDYGFEIRHDNILLTGLLLMWLVVRVRPSGLRSYFLAGALAVGLQFAAFKAFAYTIPLLLASLVFPPPGHNLPRWKLMLAVMVGAFFAFAAVRILYSASGVTSFSEGHETGAGFVVKVASTGSRFGPGLSLVRLLTQTPLLLALLGSALVVLALQLRRQKRDAFSWDGSLPEALLFVGTLGLLIINPTPFPYNLLHLVPYAYLFVFVHASKLVQEAQRRPRVLPLAMAVIVFVHLVPFAVATWRHVNWSNDRQLVLMRLAEELTDPIKDPVYDGIYLVPTRPIVHYGSFLHSLTLQNVMDESGTRIRDMLIERPAAVIIQSYRTSWLSDEDHDFIRQRYVPLADDFWVLGKVLSEGGGEFEIHHPGRYHIAPKEESNLSEPHDGNVGSVPSRKDQNVVQAGFKATLNGLPLTNRTVELNVGFHRLETAANWIPTVVWTGPQLGQAPRIPEGSHRRLFVNWY